MFLVYPIFFFIWFLGKNLCASILMYKGSELSHQI